MHEKRFARNAKWQFAANCAQAALGGGYLLLLGRGLGPTSFGVYSIVTALVSVASLLLEMRIQDVVARELCDFGDDLDKSWQNGLKLIDLFILETIGRVLPAVGLIILSPLLVQISHLPADAEWLLAIAAIGFVLGKAGIGTSTGLLRVLGRTDLIAVCMTADWTLRLLVALLLLLLGGLTIANALWIILIVGGFFNVCQLLISAKEFRNCGGSLSLAEWSPLPAFYRLKQDGRLIASNLGISLSDMMAKDLDVTIISPFVSIDKVGLYKMAKSLVQVMWRAIDPFYLAIMPEVQRLWKRREHIKLKELLIKTSIRLFLLAVTLTALFYVVVLNFGHHIFGEGYDQLSSLMILMSIWVIICAPLIWGHPLAVAIGYPEIAFGGGVFGTVFGLTSFLNLTPQYGLVGAAVAWNITLVLMFFFIASLSIYIAGKKSQ